MAKHIQDFKAGEEVPEWLLCADPKSPRAIRPLVRFEKDCSLVETGGAYWLLVPLVETRQSGPIVTVDGGRGCQVNATTLPVIVPNNVFVVYGEDVDASTLDSKER